MRSLLIRATETIVYSKNYELDELEEFLDKTLDGDFNGDVQAFTQALYEEAHNYSAGGPGAWFAEDLERHGDVQGQEWKGEVITDDTLKRDVDAE